MTILLFLEFLAVISAGIALCILHRYLAKSPLDNLPGPPSESFIAGNLRQVTDPLTASEFSASLCETYGPTHRIYGVLGGRILNVLDPRALHSMLISDVEHFPKDLTPLNTLRLLLGPGVLGTNGSQHRRQRKLLNSVFSPAHLRDMTHILYDIAQKIPGAMRDGINKAEPLDINGLMATTSLEMLGEAFLGYSFGGFVEGSPRDSLGESIKMFFATVGKVPLAVLLVPSLSRFLSGSLIRMLFRILPFPNLHRLLDISDTMRRRAINIIGLKKAALGRGDEELVARVGEGKDIMSVLLRSNIASLDTDKISDEELLAQVSTIMLAGLDTTSNGLSRILYLLAQNGLAQERLRAELLVAQGHRVSDSETTGPSVPHDELMRLPYLDAAFRETMRLYPPVGFVFRRAAKDIVVPLAWPVRGKDGSSMSEILLPRGTPVVLNIRACNRNKALWGDDALEWRPERWLEELPQELYDAHVPGVYSNLMTFSAGVRSCIGVKFAELETKIVLSALLTSFKFELTDTPVIWKFATVDYPTMGKDSTKSQLLLKVTSL
ncbi:cytochrome P450 [Lentinus tigrinus ALCF2SS1-6]|uniref:Cytochrome P450 n=1 Tax=Lentinus tigrinus ALCF2SS1-6 TaxID=1328759 RepID=A0A5C2RML5_9APHY|nr:cytochrome P450 [Lentinus tigrinus ALCF2SS1-6]